MTLPGWLERFRRTNAYDLLLALPLIVWFTRGVWRDAQNIALHLRLIGEGSETTVGALQMIAMAASALFCAILVVMLLMREAPRGLKVCGDRDGPVHRDGSPRRRGGELAWRLLLDNAGSPRLGDRRSAVVRYPPMPLRLRGILGWWQGGLS